MTDRLTFRITMGALVCLLGYLGLMLGSITAWACPCDQISPAQGFDRAQYVFTGEVVEQAGNTWTVDVDRVWKGVDKLAGRVRLLDVYTGIDCAAYFEVGRAYLFFAIVAKSSRYVYYQPQVCNWTSALKSRRVANSGDAMWLEDIIKNTYGPGERPTAEDPWTRLHPREGGERK